MLLPFLILQLHIVTVVTVGIDEAAQGVTRVMDIAKLLTEIALCFVSVLSTHMLLVCFHDL